MTDFRQVTDRFFVSPQIALTDLEAARDQGFTVVVNNRPDGESPDQPSSTEMELEAGRLGLRYVYAPVLGRPSDEAVARVREVVEAPGSKVLAFCRSGTRSIVTWAMGQTGAQERAALIAVGRAAGYDLSTVI